MLQWSKENKYDGVLSGEAFSEGVEELNRAIKKQKKEFAKLSEKYHFLSLDCRISLLGCFTEQYYPCPGSSALWGRVGE